MATAHKVTTTDRRIDLVIARAATLRDEPRAISAEYRPSLDIVIVMLSDGERLVLQRELLEGLQTATRRQLANVPTWTPTSTFPASAGMSMAAGTGDKTFD
jgi:hypothetical protein